MTQTVEDFFAGGVTAAKFEDGAFGTVIGGIITSDPRMVQQREYDTNELVFYPDGNPAMQMVVTVQAYEPQGEDDGQRSFYIKGQMKQAVGEALRKAGAKAPARGGKLLVKYVEDKPVTLKNGKSGKPQKIYAAKYEPPSATQAAAYFDEPATANSMRATNNGATDAERRQAAVSGVSAATVGWPNCPPGIDPAAWSRMNGDQRAQMYQALGLPIPQAQTTPTGGAAFRDEPPF